MEYTLFVQNNIDIQKDLEMYINIDSKGKVIDFYLYKSDFKINEPRVLPSCNVIAEHITLNKKHFEVKGLESNNPFIRVNCSFEKFCKAMKKEGYVFYLLETKTPFKESIEKIYLKV